jgi:polar amino acid transport system permease protein
MELFLHYLTLPYLLQGIGFTLGVTALGLGGGLLIGLALAGMQLSRFRLLSAVARTYAVIFRGTPLILQLVFAYDALPHIGLRLSAMAAAGLALSFNEAPFIAEILRSGVLGVDPGQITAGQALGMTPMVLMRRIIAPQAIRIMVPAFGNEVVSALKNSSLASVISVEELTLRSTQLASSTFDFFSIFFASGLIYLGLTGAASGLQLIIEALLDLDRPAPRERLRRLLPWHRAGAVVAPSVAAPALDEPEASPADIPGAPPTTTRARRVRPVAPARGELMVEVHDLRKRYGDQIVLDGLDLTVRSGAVVALLGLSGSGKSTLLRCINHLEEWDAGVVRIDGRRLGFDDHGRLLAPRAVARERADIGVGMVFQQFNLFSHLTARENVAGPLRWVHGMSR